MRILVALLVLLPATLPSGAAVSCPVQTDADAVALADAAYADTYAGSWYPFVNARYVETWLESNGVPGLQRAGVRCSDGSIVTADHLLTSVAVPTSTRIYA